MEKIKSAIQSIRQSVSSESKLSTKGIHDFSASQASYRQAQITQAVKTLQSDWYSKLPYDHVSKAKVLVTRVVSSLETQDPASILNTLNELNAFVDTLPFSKPKFSLKKLPPPVDADIREDLSELERCFDVKCYRSSIILCGRMLETALHRKYFEATAKDLLEKNPDIGLGTLVAKMSEQNIQLDPGIKQQIHLINQVRIFSVHTKKETFQPTEQQTYALILYTLDIINRLFV